MKKTVIVTLFAIAAIVGKVSAQKPAVMVSDKTGWHKIAETTVDFTKERDEIPVLGADRFASIQFKVTNAPINLQDIEVYYESGDKQNVNLNTAIKSPGESRIVSLNGGERNLKKIVMVYKTVPNHKDEKAHVEVWGLKTNTDKK